MLRQAGGVFIALGANLASEYGAPRETLEAALLRFAGLGLQVLRRSSWWRSPAQPDAAQPDFVNGVVEVNTELAAGATLLALHQLEAAFGRVRRQRWEARVLDLDLLDYRGAISDGSGGPVLPHPRLAERLFVLLPLREIAPAWRHPVSQAGLDSLISAAQPLNINILR
jgi:2-amino-4-hydroxy-6-hydroxymethyldihydropteridine diphosphokinase